MKNFASMPPAGLAVCGIILLLFACSLLVLFTVCLRYRRITRLISKTLDKDNAFLRYTVNEYADAYKVFGTGVNTPAIIENAVNVKLSSLLLCERFISNAVSLFVILGLFGTFLGLSLAVSSLTELIGYSNTSEWLSVLDSVGGGLMSALSGMGVAFYTSLVGAGCSILLTLLRTILNPAAQRESMTTALELWLDHTVAPTLATDIVKDEMTLANRMVTVLNESADRMEQAISATTKELQAAMNDGKGMVIGFNKTVKEFNEGVRDFGELDYNLRGTIERMDVSVRDLVAAMRQSARGLSGRDSGGKDAE